MVYTDMDKLPLVLDVATVGKVIGINRNSAYQLVKSEGFPSTRINKRIVVYKQALEAWLSEPRAVNF